MGKVRRKKHRKRSPQSGELEKSQQHEDVKALPDRGRAKRPAFPRTVLTGILALATLVGGAGAVLSMFSKINVSSSGALDPLSPFASPFVVLNDGYLPVKDLTFLCEIHKLVSQAGGQISTENLLFKYPQPLSSTLRASETTTMACPPPFQFASAKSPILKEPIAYAEISIVVEYKPYLLPWSLRYKSQRFRTVKMPDGSLYWLPVMEPN